MLKLLLFLLSIIIVIKGGEMNEPVDLKLIDSKNFEVFSYNSEKSLGFNRYLYSYEYASDKENNTSKNDNTVATGHKDQSSDKLLNQTKITNEEKSLSLLKEYPSKVIIHYVYNNGAEYSYDHCGGVLISNDHILTSSMCFGYFKNPDDKMKFTLSENETVHYKISMFANSYKFNDLKFFFDVMKITIKPSFGLAILKIETLNVSEVVNHGFLADIESSINDNVTVLQLPHYLDEKDINGQIQLMKKGIISIVEPKYINVPYSDEKIDISDIFYGYYKSQATGHCNIWQGDPVYNDKREIIGIVQFPGGCSYGDFSKFSYLVFTNIYKYQHWIREGLSNSSV